MRSKGITPALANGASWQINWTKTDLAKTSSLCTGRSTPGATNWVAYKGFRVYVKYTASTITPAQANQKGWYVNWGASVPSTTATSCVGVAPISWTDAGTNLVYTDVSTASCTTLGSGPFKYLTSLGGSGGHYTAAGATSLVSPTSTGFRVYLSQYQLTAASATASKYHINWAIFP